MTYIYFQGLLSASCPQNREETPLGPPVQVGILDSYASQSLSSGNAGTHAHKLKGQCPHLTGEIQKVSWRKWRLKSASKDE